MKVAEGSVSLFNSCTGFFMKETKKYSTQDKNSHKLEITIEKPIHLIIETDIDEGKEIPIHFNKETDTDESARKLSKECTTTQKPLKI